MGRWGRVAVGGLILALLALCAPVGEPEPVEAMSKSRARIIWQPAIPYPSLLRDWQSFQDEHAEELRDDTLVLFRAGTFARRTNGDASAVNSGLVYRVTTGAPFDDDFLFTPTVDLDDAVIAVNQPSWGGGTQCHVLIVKVEDNVGNNVVPPPGGRGTVDLGPITTAGAPYMVRLRSQVPRLSQESSGRATPRILTSVVRVLERGPTPTAPRRTPRPGQPTPTPVPPQGPCDLAPGGTAYRSLNQPLTVRTELDSSDWATANGRPTPTPIALR